MKIPLRFLFTAGLGAAAMYYLDPEDGRRRRALVRERLEHGERQAPEGAGPANPRPERIRPPQAHTEFMQEIWSPAVRTTGGVAGGTAALYGLGRGGIHGTLLGAAGLLLLARAVTNTELRRLFGIGVTRDAAETAADRTRVKDEAGSGRTPRPSTARGEAPEQPGPVH